MVSLGAYKAAYNLSSALNPQNAESDSVFKASKAVERCIAANFMEKPILLTGASGFVGYQVLKALHVLNRSVRLVLREERASIAAEFTNVESVVVTKDLFKEDRDFWLDALAGADSVVHLAWYVEPGAYLSSPRNIDCLMGTLRLSHAAIETGLHRFVGIGTCFEYDMSGGTLSVDTPLKPTSVYGATKAALYQALSSLLPENDIEFLWCRLFYLHGEREPSGRLVPYLKERLSSGQTAELTSGNQVRDFMDVRDAGRLIAELACSSSQGAVNVCSGVPMTVRELAESVADGFGARDLLRFGARQDNAVDPPRIVGVKNF